MFEKFVWDGETENEKKLHIPLETRLGGGADAGTDDDDAVDVATAFGGTLPDSYSSVLLALTLANFSPSPSFIF